MTKMKNRNRSGKKGKKIVFIDKPGGRTIILRSLFNPNHTFEPLFKKTKKDPGFAPYVSRVMNEKGETI